MCLLLHSLAICLASISPRTVQASRAAGDVSQKPQIAVEVPLRFEGSRAIPIVEARINGRGPFRFYFDTGASGCVLDETFAHELALESRGKVPVGDPGAGGELQADQLSLTTLSIGDLEWRDVTALCFDRSALGAREGIKGVLGIDLAEKRTLTVDLARNRLLFSDEPVPQTGEGVVELFAGAQLPEIELIIAGKPARAHFDTGSPGGFNLPEAVAQDLKFKSAPVVIGRGKTVAGVFELKSAELDGDIVLAGRHFSGPTVRINPRFPITNVGCEVLRQFAISIDLRHHRAQFLPADKVASEPSPPRKIGIRIASSTGALTIDSVDDGSPAKKAGLRAGDVVLSVNGQSVSAGDTTPLSRASEGRAAIKLVVRRGGINVDVTIPEEPTPGHG